MNSSTPGSQKPLLKLNDTDLLDRARQGDELAFELIVRRHNQALFRAARGVLNDEGDAQEAVQEAYLSAFLHMDSFQGRASLKTWLTRITVNQAISFRRRRRPFVSLDEKVAILHDKQSQEQFMVPPVTDKDSPEKSVRQQETRQFLETAIGRLPDIYRSVFLLRIVEGMSVSDCAYSLETNEAVIKKRLSRAREMLRKDLVRELESQESGVFEFAGQRCDAVTSFVMAALTHRGLIKRDFS